MAQNIRQSKLFASEDYKAVYESYINANLQAFDYDTIRTSMVEYVRNTYPENYNDWIESSEFVALLDVVAQMGHNLAFRVDLNSRNNFLSTAERQDSVYKLAEFIGYTPRRNVSAFGEMKVISAKTNEQVIGSAGTSLGGQDIKFESTSNVNNLDDFIAVMNSILQYGNQFGSPKKQTTVSNITQQFYELNNTSGQIKFDVTGVANGVSSTFNIVSVDYDNNIVYEKTPSPTSAFGLYYKNSGLGLTNKDTGFFFGIKEGTLAFKDVQVADPIDNQTIDINIDNINNSDVWVQTVNTDGTIVKQWTNVKNIASYNNTSYNGVMASNRDVFSVRTRKNNQISVNFADQTFGNAPLGIIRVWYRVSKNETYTVRPDDLSNKKITIKYQGLDGNEYIAQLGLQLQTSITSASSAETLDNIKQNAPLAYASQNRLVTADDYNTLFAYQSSNVVKVKSLNRTFSGHSRYIDFTDPTGEYSNLLVNGADGRLYEDNSIKSQTTVVGMNKDYIFEKYVKGQLGDFDLINLYYTKFTSAFNILKSDYGYTPNITFGDANFTIGGFIWTVPGGNVYNANTGYFLLKNGVNVERVGKSQTNYLNQFRVGAMVKFITPTGTTVWSKVLNVFGYGLGIDGTQLGKASGLKSSGLGAITMDTMVPTGSVVEIIVPSFPRLFKTRESNIIKTYLDAKLSFTLWYDHKNQSWELDNSPVAYSSAELGAYNNTKATWLLYFKFESNKYNIYTRTTKYILKSDSVAFTNVSLNAGLDSLTKKKAQDTVEFTVNNIVDDAITTTVGKMNVSGVAQDANGVIDASHVYLSLVDDNYDNRPDNPLVFSELTNPLNLSPAPTPVITEGSETYTGLNELNFVWKHIAADREIVDPSYTNIIDVYVLDKTYDTAYRTWLLTNEGLEPLPPTSNALAASFVNVEKQKTISDTVIYKPVKYKTLFGPIAHSSLRATFDVVKVKGSNVVDSEVRGNVVKAIQSFFAVDNWSFGETFYFTELAAYVHKELSMSISSFTIVPHGSSSVFGELFEITPNIDEMFIPDVSIDDIDIVTNVVTKTN